MKRTGLVNAITLMTLFLIGACNEEGTPSRRGSNDSPAREIHYNFETGEKTGEKTLTYDANGYLIETYFEDLRHPAGDEQIHYEYDGDFNLIRTMQREPAMSSEFYINEFTYENGLKTSEISLFGSRPAGYKSLYFYTGTLLDSVQRFYYSTIEDRYQYLTTTFYRNDALGRIFEVAGKDGRLETLLRYEGNNLLETCNPVNETDDLEVCIRHEYNADGDLIRTFDVSPWWNKILEERFYEDGVLDEKRIYTYPGYQPGNTVDVLQIRYAY